MSEMSDDPRCPECGGPIGQTATYCMHCSADLTDERAAADAEADSVWDQAEAPSTSTEGSTAVSGNASYESRETAEEYAQAILETIANASSTAEKDTRELLAPDGLVDNTLTVLVGIVGGIVVGVVGTTVLGIVTGSGWAIVFGLIAWLAATAYLVRRRTVQAAIAKSGYAITITLLLVPVIALSPVIPVSGGIEERSGLFLVLLFFVAIPAGGAAVIGWIASRFVPEDAGQSSP